VQQPLNDAEVLAAVSKHPLMKVLDANVLKTIVRASRLVRFGPKRPVLKEGEPPDHAFCLLRGSVRVFHRSGDSEVLLKLFQAPAMFGEMEVISELPFMEHVTTIDPSEILHIPAAVFRQIVKKEAAFACALAEDLAMRLCISAHNQKALAFSDVETRLANLLLDYAEFFGEPDGEGIRLTLALSQGSMAHDLAVTRKAVNATLTKFKEEGLVDKREARFVILNADALKTRGSGNLRLSYRIDQGLATD
jgi:CRP/FNR family cyclic AMP-dependent transcriptional regulator